MKQIFISLENRFKKDRILIIYRNCLNFMDIIQREDEGCCKGGDSATGSRWWRFGHRSLLKRLGNALLLVALEKHVAPQLA